jgi:hypothetical protein
LGSDLSRVGESEPFSCPSIYCRHGRALPVQPTDARDTNVHNLGIDPIRELAWRGEALGTSEAKQMLEYGIEVGRGGF